MEKPFVSLIMPCYNKASQIRDMLASVERQKWENIELIAVNDGSTDDTRTILAMWEPRLTERGIKMKIIDRVNGGVAAAVKTGLEYYTGDYVCFPDCDDVLDDEYVSAMLETLENTQAADFVLCDWYDCYPSLGKQIQTSNFSNDALRSITAEDLFIGRVFMGVWRLMVRSDYVRKIGLNKMVTTPRLTQEVQIYTLLYANGGRGVHLARPLYYYNKESTELAAYAMRGRPDALRNYYEGRSWLFKASLEQAVIDEQTRAWYLSLAEMKCVIDLSLASADYPPSGILFRKAMQHTMIGLSDADKDILAALSFPGRRIFGFGILGKVGKEYLPWLKDTEMYPQVFWDRKALTEEHLWDGEKVVPAAFDTLREGDIICCFPNNLEVLQEVKEKAKPHGAKVLSYYDITTYLSYIYYPYLRYSKHSDQPFQEATR